MHKPILIWCCSRSRSSLVSKIFINHGVWWGDTHRISAGYQTYENQNIKKLVKATIRASHGNPLPQGNYKNFIAQLMEIVPDRQWMMKIGVDYYHAFQPLNPHNIFITRKPEDVARSVCEKGHARNYREALKMTIKRYEFMRQVGSIFVDTDKLMVGDYSEIEQAITSCGLKYYKNRVESAFI